MGYHPINARVRVVVTAKNQRGTIGEQYHIELLSNGSCRMIKAAPHEHARPAKSPATWQADPAVASEENEIIELVSVMMDGKMISKQLLEGAITKVYSKRAYHRTMSKLKMQTRRIDNSFDWYWVPTQRMRREAYYRKQEEAPRQVGVPPLGDQPTSGPARTSAAGVPSSGGESTLYPARTSAAVAPQPIIPHQKGDRRTAS